MAELRRVLCLFCVLALAAASPRPPNCTAVENRSQKFRGNVDSADIYCRGVPASFLIENFYFVEKPYPQHLHVLESTIPVVPNYSSLLNMRPIRRLFARGLDIKYVTPGAFRNMELLEELDLRFNQLNTLADGMFLGLVNLKRLHLSSNNISEVSRNVFKDLPKLEYLDITNNPIQDIHQESFVRQVYVNKNVVD